MNKLVFYLRSPKAQESIVMVRYNASGKRFVISTDIKVPCSKWDTENYRVRAGRDPLLGDLNIRLTVFEKAFNDALHHILYSRKPLTPAAIRREMEEHYSARVPLVDPSAYVTQVMEQIRKGDRLTLRGSRYSSSSLIVYSQVKRFFEKYQEKHGRFSWEDIDQKFYTRLLNMMTQEQYSTNYIGSVVKGIKSICHMAEVEGLHSSTWYRQASFRKLQEDTITIYLTMEEIAALTRVELNEYDAHVRDVFVFACLTGLRFGDLQQVNAQLVTDGILTLRPSKTGRPVSIPLHPAAQDIIARYMGKLPRVLSNQKMNEYIKEIGRHAGITTSTEVHITTGGTDKTCLVPKHQLITTHTARRSFATNAYLAGVPAQSIMMITGHRTEKVFLKYLKMSGMDNARKMQGHAFFMVSPGSAT
jgi:integrase